jgi:hypothetical protein
MNGSFNSHQFLFQNEPRSGRAQQAFHQQFSGNVNNLVITIANKCSLARREAIRFDDTASLSGILSHIFPEFVEVIEDLERCRRYGGSLHEFLGKNLRGFNPRCSRTGTEAGNAVSSQPIRDAIRQRLFRSDNHEVRRQARKFLGKR